LDPHSAPTPNDIDSSAFAALCACIAEMRGAAGLESFTRTPRPFLIGITGSVAVGKTCFAAKLKWELLQRRVCDAIEAVSTDGFLLSNAQLQSNRQIDRKGFPEAYDSAALAQFLRDALAGRPKLHYPVYSHEAYDVVPGEGHTIDLPQILIVEGVNILQSKGAAQGAVGARHLPDLAFDLTIFLRADEDVVFGWYLNRTLQVRRHEIAEGAGGATDPLRREKIAETARWKWHHINLPNYHQNIALALDTADVVIEKNPDHTVALLQIRATRPSSYRELS
jgi:type I pantothenate kinase